MNLKLFGIKFWKWYVVWKFIKYCDVIFCGKNFVLIVYNVFNIFRVIVFYIIFFNKMVNELLNKRRK